MKGDNVVYKLVDSIFSRYFFTLVSWTGVTRGTKKKDNFSQFVKTFQFLFKLAKRCDPQYTEHDLKAFLRKIIDNSRRRYEISLAEQNDSAPRRMSTVKNRPSKKKMAKEKPKEDTIEEEKSESAGESIVLATTKEKESAAEEKEIDSVMSVAEENDETAYSAERKMSSDSENSICHLDCNVMNFVRYIFFLLLFYFSVLCTLQIDNASKKMKFTDSWLEEDRQISDVDPIIEINKAKKKFMLVQKK